MQFKRLYSRKADKSEGVMCDQIGKLITWKSKKDYPDRIRRIKFFDQENYREFFFISNNTELKAT